ncbi:MAG TPA: MBL fold metallo-hydrolase, partial [Dehalococcoidia bacterium]|nr:MBL fold metallo-hydrolase [Dehalococcoidia bacterium]
MKVRIVGAHQAESRDTGFVSLLIDGHLALDASSLAGRLTLEEQRAIRWVVLSHYHYDHVKDLPTICFNSVPYGLEYRASKDVYASEVVADRVGRYLMNGDSWPDFRDRPSAHPAARFHPIEAYQDYQVGDYTIRCVPSVHKVPTLAIQVSRDGRSVLYSGDAGPGSALNWTDLDPDHVVTEVTFSNDQSEVARAALHYTPELLGADLRGFRERKGYLPPITAVHMNPIYEDRIRQELAALSRELDTPIEAGREDQVIEVEACPR